MLRYCELPVVLLISVFACSLVSSRISLAIQEQHSRLYLLTSHRKILLTLPRIELTGTVGSSVRTQSSVIGCAAGIVLVW
ncbi:hypothetical protein HYPBUDRAFT_233565 [Hyphopichia burtonii NRRL Y-1933]|uniref:Uncharacterized protein n=1 Tax=Hyphopichia burtonii NRRL Y-1933 TaxID=984485 RepID=A0A1E4RC55_9ASCO|nr:hypothetical protein HYPBUDRAFT_233565 [Hyphopichia burtonii NRRL Y-1933]ODV64859.1 hypothetical protein HYPBUDRAFT_233565 [Hyphopichia burtonii NRRL Y-1933]